MSDRFQELGLATITSLPSAELRRIIDGLVAEGWVVTDEYDGMDAWIDYGRIALARAEETILCEWDNWTEGSLEGKRATIEALGARYRLPVAYRSRWDRDP